MAVGMKKQSAVSAKQTLIAKTDKMAAENVLYSAANVLQILRHFHLCLTDVPPVAFAFRSVVRCPHHKEPALIPDNQPGPEETAYEKATLLSADSFNILFLRVRRPGGSPDG